MGLKVNNERFLLDSNPYQLGSKPKINGTYGTVSLNNENKGYAFKGKCIDYILYSNNFLKLQQSFVFNSMILDESALDKYGMSREALIFSKNGIL